MAVVEKKPETTTPSVFDRLGVASLAGVVYIVAALAVAFRAIPAAVGLVASGMDPFPRVAIIIALSLGVLAALAVLGVRLMGGARSRSGLRGGIFLGFVFLMIWAFVSRWFGGLIEGWVYDNGWFPGNEVMVGGGIAAVFSALLGFWLLRIFLRPSFEQRFVRLEQAGWFTARAYKPGQGMRVRRGTILGILLLGGSGIWVMVNRDVFGADDWRLNVPFTGDIAVDELGDAATILAEQQVSRERVRVLSVGSAGDTLKANTTVDRETALEAISTVAAKKKQSLDELIKRLKSVEAEKSRQAGSRSGEAKRPYQEEQARLRVWIEDLTKFDKQLEQGGDPLFFLQREIDRFIAAEKDRERQRLDADPAARGRNSLKEEMAAIEAWDKKDPLPVVGYVLDRFTVRDINERLDPLIYRIVNKDEIFTDDDIPQQYRFKAGQIVHREEFDKAVEALKKDSADPRQVEEQAKEAAPPTTPMKGKALYAGITLLPTIRYTLPLLLLALIVWLAWRVVNMPTFADFLIATEAEMNKVSWTTRHRLIQDTIVVLVTMVLMAVFLFVVDIAWARLLSSGPIGVLRVDTSKPPDDPKDLKW